MLLLMLFIISSLSWHASLSVWAPDTAGEGSTSTSSPCSFELFLEEKNSQLGLDLVNAVPGSIFSPNPTFVPRLPDGSV